MIRIEILPVGFLKRSAYFLETVRVPCNIEQGQERPAVVLRFLSVSDDDFAFIRRKSGTVRGVAPSRLPEVFDGAWVKHPVPPRQTARNARHSMMFRNIVIRPVLSQVEFAILYYNNAFNSKNKSKPRKREIILLLFITVEGLSFRVRAKPDTAAVEDLSSFFFSEKRKTGLFFRLKECKL